MKFTFLILLFAGIPALAAVTKLIPDGGEIKILAIGRPSFIKVEGKGAPATGEIKVDQGIASAQIKFELNSLDTGIELRNQHMKEKYLEVAQHPEALLELDGLPIGTWSPQKPELKPTSFSGNLKLHGVTKLVQGTLEIAAGGIVTATMKIKMSDFNIQIPTYMGITVADEVEVKVKIDRLQVKI